MLQKIDIRTKNRSLDLVALGYLSAGGRRGVGGRGVSVGWQVQIMSVDTSFKKHAVEGAEEERHLLEGEEGFVS